MDERFVIPVFIARAELQMAVEKKSNVVFEAREHDMLITRVAREDDVVGVDIVLGGGSNVAGFDHADPQTAQNEHAHGAESARSREPIGEQIRAPERHASVDKAKKHRGTYEPKMRHEENGKN